MRLLRYMIHGVLEGRGKVWRIQVVRTLDWKSIVVNTPSGIEIFIGPLVLICSGTCLIPTYDVRMVLMQHFTSAPN